jgi:hypothetical protein
VGLTDSGVGANIGAENICLAWRPGRCGCQVGPPERGATARRSEARNHFT